MVILEPDNFTSVKKEYSILWSLISRFNESIQFKSTSDEKYKLAYIDLLMLAEKYKIRDENYENMDLKLIRKMIDNHVKRCQG
jgi:hypothetical protein